jgi:hypothetical protein
LGLNGKLNTGTLSHQRREPMDTDELTEMAYETVTRACDVCEFLRAEIGASAANFRSEDAFLRGTLELLDTILEDPEDYLDSRRLLDEKDAPSFAIGVEALRAHVAKTLRTPKERRGKTSVE